VLVQRLRIGIALGLLAMVGSPGVQSSELPEKPASIYVSVYDDAGLGQHRGDLAELADQRVGDRVDPVGVARLSLGRLMLALELLSLTFRPQ